jgi:hypothetical protein
MTMEYVSGRIRKGRDKIWDGPLQHTVGVHSSNLNLHHIYGT